MLLKQPGIAVGIYHAQPPKDADQYNNYGCALALIGRVDAALDGFRASQKAAKEDKGKARAEHNTALVQELREALERR